MKRITNLQLLVLVVISGLLLISTAAIAAKKVNFSGEWTLNESKSELGEGRFFSAIKMSVQHDGNTIIIESTRTGRDGEERKSSETLTMDGQENINKNGNRTSKSTATWSEDRKTLTIKSNMEFERQGETFKMESTAIWTLEEKGKVLKIQSDSSSPRGERSVTLVYDKE